MQPTESETTSSVEPNPRVEQCLPDDRQTSSLDQDSCACPELSFRRTLPTFGSEASSDELHRETPLFYNDNMAEGSNALLPSPLYGKPEEDIKEFLKHIELWAMFRCCSSKGRLLGITPSRHIQENQSTT